METIPKASFELPTETMDSEEAWSQAEPSFLPAPGAGNTDFYLPLPPNVAATPAFTYDTVQPALAEETKEAAGNRPQALRLEEGLERDAIEFGLVALEALAATLYPRFPHSEITTDPQIRKAEDREASDKALNAAAVRMMQGIGAYDGAHEFPLQG